MSSRKVLCAVSLTAFFGVSVALFIASEVRAGVEQDDVVEVDQTTLAQVGAFVGEYRFVGGQKERDGIDAAIERSVAEVSPVVRGLGRSRLRESNEVAASIEFEVSGETLTIHQAGEAHAAPVDGSKVKAKSKHGDKIQVSHKLRGSKLTQRIAGDGGDRINTYKLSDDGKRLTLSVEITSGHLPVPVEYSLSFERR